jgi:hypothetical protein
MPVHYASAVSDEQYQVLKQRNRWLDGISQALCLVGIVGGAFLPLLVRGRPVEFTGWDVGLQFGLGVGAAIGELIVRLAVHSSLMAVIFGGPVDEFNESA